MPSDDALAVEEHQRSAERVGEVVADPLEDLAVERLRASKILTCTFGRSGSRFCEIPSGVINAISRGPRISIRDVAARASSHLKVERI